MVRVDHGESDQLREQARLAVLERYGMLDVEAQPVFDDLVALAAQVCRTPIAALSLVDADRQWFAASIGLPVKQTPRHLAFCNRAISDPTRPLIVRDTMADPRFATNPLVTDPPRVRSYTGVPLVGAGGAALGTLCVLDTRPRRLTGGQLEGLEALARQAVAQLELRRSLADLVTVAVERLVAEGTLAEAQQRFGAAFDAAPLAMSLTRADGSVVAVNAAFSRLVGLAPAELDGRSLVHFVADGERAAETEVLAALGDGTIPSSVRERVLATPLGSRVVLITTVPVRSPADTRPLLLSQTEDLDARQRGEQALRLAGSTLEAIFTTDAEGAVTFWNAGAEAMFGWTAAQIVGQSATAIVPPEHRERWQAGLDRLAEGGGSAALDRTIEAAGQRRDGATFPVDVSLTRWQAGGSISYTAVVRDISEQVALRRQLERRANVDELTGLASAARLHDHLTAAAGAAEPSALVRVDVDRFRVVNHSLGHAIGDELLVGLAQRLRATLVSGDRAGRLGGDEFGVLRPRVASGEEAMDFAQQLLAVFTEPFDLDGRRVGLTAAAGVALVRPGDDPDDVLREADTALYSAKEQGSGRAQLYDERLRRQALERLELEADLREAIAADAFELRFQPEVELASGRVVGLEALVRWPHPERGPIAPEDFIPLAEETGLIVPLGERVLRSTLAQVAAWRLAAPDFIAPPVGVNVSAAQLAQPDFVAMVRDALTDSGVPPAQLTLEVTESALVADLDTIIARLQALADDGIGIAIDDFGTGYSSFAYLHRLPASHVKIDRTFTEDLPAGPGRAIVEAVIPLARGLGLVIVAEGVETAEQRDALLDLGADVGQGFWFSEPLRPDDVPAGIAALARAAREPGA